MNRLTVASVLTAFVVFPLGLAAGFALGVYSTDLCEDIFEVASSVEEPADVTHSTTIAAERFRLEYPGNWTLARDDKNFDIDQYFSIDSPGYSYVLFAIWRVDAERPDEFQDSIAYFSKLLKVSKRSSFAKWGRYGGSGVHLVGHYVGKRAEVRIFSHTSGDLTFTVTEFFDTANREQVKPGYDLIEATFVLNAVGDTVESRDGSLQYSAQAYSMDVD